MISIRVCTKDPTNRLVMFLQMFWKTLARWEKQIKSLCAEKNAVSDGINTENVMCKAN